MNSIKRHEKTTRKLIQQIKDHCDHADCQQQIVLACGHRIQRNAANTTSAPNSICPQCHAPINKHYRYAPLKITQRIRSIISFYYIELLEEEEAEAEEARRIAAVIKALQQDSDIPYFLRLLLQRSMRTQDGDLLITKRRIACHTTALTESEINILSQLQQLIETLFITQSQAQHINNATPYATISANRRGEQTNTHRQAPAAWTQFKLQCLRQHGLSPTPRPTLRPSIYSRTCRETVSRWLTQQPQQNAESLWQQCVNQPQISSHCPINMTDNPRNPVYTNCGHVFDEAAIRQWLQQHDSCPCCRKPVTALVKSRLRSALNVLLNPELMTAAQGNAAVAERSPQQQLTLLMQIIQQAIQRSPREEYRVVWQRENKQHSTVAIDERLNQCVTSTARLLQQHHTAQARQSHGLFAQHGAQAATAQRRNTPSTRTA